MSPHHLSLRRQALLAALNLGSGAAREAACTLAVDLEAAEEFFAQEELFDYGSGFSEICSISTGKPVGALL